MMNCSVCTHCGGCDAGRTEGKQVGGECFNCHAIVDVHDLVCTNCGAPNLYYQSGMKGFGYAGTGTVKVR